MKKRGAYGRRESRSMLEGLTRHNPPESDASMKPKGGDVADNACRESVAKTPKTLGPRNA